MGKEYSRSRRVGDLLQRELAAVIQEELQDPALGMLTVSGVKVSPDFAHADVYITVLDNRLEVPAVMDSLNRAAGHLRHVLAHRVVLRSIPRLRFVYDESVERGTRLSELIDAARASDEDKHK
jgi:ribosome-binding factor A